MKKIVRHLVTKPNFTGSIYEIACTEFWSDINVVTSLVPTSCNKFIINGDVITYIPSFGIIDRNTLEKTITSAFPCGVAWKDIQDCYDFIESDISELIFEKKCFVHMYGKSNERIFFAPPQTPQILYDIWNNDNTLYHESTNTSFRKRKK